MNLRSNEGVAIADIMKVLEARVICAEKDVLVRWVVASGLMSDVLTTEEEDILLLSNLTTVQLIRTADMVAAPVVVITSGKQVPESTILLAEKLGIMLLSTRLPVFEACSRLAPLFFEV
jgi:hypothetical protein